MDRMRNVDGHIGWKYDPLYDVHKSNDGVYAVTYIMHEYKYQTHVAKTISPKGVKMYTRHCKFDTLSDAIHWCETHRAVGA